MNSPLILAINVVKHPDLDALLAELTDGIKEGIDGLPTLSEPLEELFLVEGDGQLTPGTNEVVVKLNPSDRLLDLAAAVRARKADGLVAKEIGHVSETVSQECNQ